MLFPSDSSVTFIVLLAMCTVVKLKKILTVMNLPFSPFVYMLLPFFLNACHVALCLELFVLVCVLFVFFLLKNRTV